MDLDQRPAWFYQSRDRWFGPVSEAELLRLHLGRELPRDAPVWHADQPQPTAFDRLPAFAGIQRLQTRPAPARRRPDWLDSRATPLPRIALFALFWLVVLLAALGAVAPAAELRPGIRSLAFLALLLAVYLGLWTTYFASSVRHPRLSWLRVPTLRNVLQYGTFQWERPGLAPAPNADATGEAVPGSEGSDSGPEAARRQSLQRVRGHEVEHAYREKARTSITALAVMIAASLLVLAQANAIFLSPVERPVLGDVFVAMSALAAFTAVACFFIATDALDSLFNRYRGGDMELRLVTYLYQITINPKYVGFCALTVSILFLVAFHSPTAAGYYAAIIVAIGYPYWFPPRSTVDPELEPGAGRARLPALFSRFAADRPGFFVRLLVFGLLAPTGMWLVLGAATPLLDALAGALKRIGGS